MTGYTFSIGYISGHSYKGDKDDAWLELVIVTEALKKRPDRIVAEARRLNAPEQCEQGCCTLMSLAGAYQHTDATIVIQHEEQTIDQYASGDRMLKEHVRRAFCRLLIEDMHRLGIEVNLKVY